MKSLLTFFGSLLTAGILFTGCTSPGENQLPEHPNVLFIIVDDLNDFQGTYGGHPQAKAPNIDKLAASGVVFTNAQSNAPVCSPSRNSMFTGVYPHNSRDFGWTPHFRQQVLKNNRTLVELFRDNGYYTLGTGKLYHVNVLDYWNEWGVDEMINYGPHAFDGEKLVGHPSVPEPFRGINIVDGSFAPLSDVPEHGYSYGFKPFRYVSDDDRDLMPDEQHAEWAVKKIRELENRDTDQPFFMGVGFVKPHTPLYAPERFFEMFPLDGIELPVIKENDMDDCHYKSVYEPTEMGLHYYQALLESYPDGDEGLRRVLQGYLACVAFVDEQIGKVMDALDNSKFRDNTIVVFTTDHGWQFGEKDYLYKNSPWEETTRVPLMVRAPGESKPGTSTDQPVALIDILPTLVDMCNLAGTTVKNDSAVPPDGFSFRPFIRDPDCMEWEGPNGALTVLGAGINKPIEGIGENRSMGALWHIFITANLDQSWVWKMNYSYRTKDWRYIHYRNGKEELYDHRTDPYEWNNLAGEEEHKEILGQLRKEMMDIITKRQQ